MVLDNFIPIMRQVTKYEARSIPSIRCQSQVAILMAGNNLKPQTTKCRKSVKSHIPTPVDIGPMKWSCPVLTLTINPRNPQKQKIGTQLSCAGQVSHIAVEAPINPTNQPNKWLG